MLIQCTLKREAPIVVPIGNEKYTFALDALGRNVAEVWIESHIEAFLAVSHLYRKVEEDGGAPLDRKGVIAALKTRNIPFKVTESNDALRAKLAAAGPT